MNRRFFVKRSSQTLAAAAAAIQFPHIGRGQVNSDPLKLAVVGCGGRGAGAANQALTADSNTKLVAMADVFADKLQVGLKSLSAAKPNQVDVPAGRQFVGLDGYKEAIAASDVVILATPCAFRPAHFELAVKLGKHVFLEKPVAVDAPGIRRVLAAGEEAKRKGLKVAVCGAAPKLAGVWREGRMAEPERAFRKVLTMRSSSEWNETTARMPPGRSNFSAPSSPRSNSPSSSFT